jgi:hypothetical protein
MGNLDFAVKAGDLHTLVCIANDKPALSAGNLARAGSYDGRSASRHGNRCLAAYQLRRKLRTLTKIEACPRVQHNFDALADIERASLAGACPVVGAQFGY